MFTFHVCVSTGCYLYICAITFVVKSKRCSLCNGLFCGPGVRRNTAAILETMSCFARQFWKTSWLFWMKLWLCKECQLFGCEELRPELHSAHIISGICASLHVAWTSYKLKGQLHVREAFQLWPGSASLWSSWLVTGQDQAGGGFSFQAAAGLSLRWQQLPGAEILIMLPLVWHW